MSQYPLLFVDSIYKKFIFLISQPQHMLKLMDKKILKILRSKILFI